MALSYSNYQKYCKKTTPNTFFLGKDARVSKKYSTFAAELTKTIWLRDVAQLVAHYVRDVGVGRSSRLIPTKTLMYVCELDNYGVSRVKMSAKSR